MVVILSEWWLFCLSGGRGRPLPTTVGTSLEIFDLPLRLTKVQHHYSLTNAFQLVFSGKAYCKVELGNITILSYIVILECHDNRYQREIFIIVISAAQYYHQYHDYHKIYSSKTFTSVKYFIIYSQFLCL